MSNHPIRYGAFVPQGWKLEYTGVDPRQAWETSVAWAQYAEGLGYDHLWVYDHVETVPRRERTHCFEAFTMLAALSQVTEKAELGQLVTCVGYRNVGLLAKEAACVDVMSNGRLILGIGAGWFDREYQAYGYEYPSNRDRLALLNEALEVIPKLWSEETVTYAGHYLQLDGAYCEPAPLRSPRPPILVGGGGEKVTLRIAARHADMTNWQVGLDSFIHKSNLLEGYCEEIGRDPNSIIRTHGPDCLIVNNQNELDKWLDTKDGGHLWAATDHEEYLRDNFVGTVEQVAEKAQAFLDAGCSEFILWFRDAPSYDSLTAWLQEVVPLLD